MAKLPEVMVIEPVVGCNLKCRACSIGTGALQRKSELMSLDLFNKIVEEIKGYVNYVYFCNVGEPLLHPDTYYMLKKLKQFSKVCVATNGVLVNATNSEVLTDFVDDLCVSIFATDRETYKLMHGVDKFDAAMNGLNTLSIKRRGNVSWVFLVTSLNEYQIGEAKSLAIRLNVRLNLKSPHVSFCDRSMLPTDKKFWRYKDDFSLKFDRRTCQELNRVGYILSNGDVVTCCFDQNGIIKLGNVNENTFANIWNSEMYEKLRSDLSMGKLNEVCLNLCGNFD